MEHTKCVADTETTLIGLSEIANIPFKDGEFSKFEDTFVDSGIEKDFFSLKGIELEISVLLEKYEGYFFVTIIGEGTCFEKAKVYLSKCS
jgi:hypothetical protein